LRPADAEILTASRALADYFEDAAKSTGIDAQQAANWIIGDLSAVLNRDGLDIAASRIPADALGAMLARIDDGTISGKIAKEVFESMWAGEGSADDIIAAKGLKQITDESAIDRLVDEIIAAHPQQVSEYRSGKDKVLGYLVGQVMKASRGKANPGQVNEALIRRLNES
jgi:aspartyl-tRNA(Asn)/glutamyl-tRNA(Gln) amidotransferase subunit B